MLKQKIFNYITLILAIMTIFMVVSTSQNNESRWPCVIMLLITLVFSYISRKYNDKILYIRKKDKEQLDKIDYIMENGRVKKVYITDILEKNKK